jgi:hypothetical protein
MPGGWVPGHIEHLDDRKIGKFSGLGGRAAYIAVSSQAEAQQLSWERNIVGPSWSLNNFEAAYRTNQSWFSYLLCFQMVAIRSVPVRSLDIGM